MLLGYPGVALDDPLRPALDVLDTAMSGLSSQLATEIREKRGLAYYAGATHRPGLGTGLFVVYAGTRAEALPEVRALMDAEGVRLRGAGLTAEEFERARRQIVADHEMSLQDNQGLALACALNELYGVGYAYDFAIPKRMEALTREAVRAAAAAVLSTNREAVSVVLPAAEGPGKL